MVDDVIGFAGTNHGTTMAHADCPRGCIPANSQQASDSMFIRALNSGQETFGGISYTEVYSHTDEEVQPNNDSNGTSSLHTGNGRITNVAIQDICPADTTEHGSFFVMAHFHYTIMGGLIFAFMSGIYYWLPKMTGIKLNERLGKLHFWTMFIFFNTTFLPLFALGLMGMPRRVFEYARNLETLNDWVSISAFCLGVSILIFLINFAMSMLFWREPEVANPWRSRSLEWQLSTPPPPENFKRVPVILSGPYDYGVKEALPVADLDPPLGVIGSAYAPASGVEA